MAPVFLLITFLPINKRFYYQELKNDCFNHGIWIYDRINNNLPIDILFMGSSHTINGINDKLIQNKLENENLRVVNFGYCRLGRNFIYSLLKETLKSKKIKYLVLEVTLDENNYGHPIFPYVADTWDVVFANVLFSRDYFTDIHKHFIYRIELMQDIIFKKLVKSPINKNEHGFASSNVVASVDLLNKTKGDRSGVIIKDGHLKRNYLLTYPRRYLRKIAKLCKNKHTEIYFLYLPEYGYAQPEMMEYDTYIRYGEVIIPPDSIYNKMEFWGDENHLNVNGGNALSEWIALDLNQRINSKN